MKNINSPSVEDIESLGLSIIEEAGENYNPSPKHRIAAFTELPGSSRVANRAMSILALIIGLGGTM